MRILIVEDEIKTLNGIANLLWQIGNGYEVVGMGKNGAEGVSLALELKPDVIITDIQMNQMTGLAMMKELQERKLDCKYIIVSGYADFSYAREALTLGSVDYLLKPMTMEMLEDVLKKVEGILKEETAAIHPLSFTTEQLLERVLFMPNEANGKYTKALESRFQVNEDLMLLMVKGEHRFVWADSLAIEAELCRALRGMPYFLCTDEKHKELFVLVQTQETDALWKSLDACVAVCREKINQYIVFSAAAFQGVVSLLKQKQEIQDNANWNLTIKKPVTIRTDLIAKLPCQKLNYPSEIERTIIKKIDAGDMQGIEEEIESFLKVLDEKSYYYTDIREALICLTAAILYAIRTASYGLYENINNLNILDWVQNIMFIEHYLQTMLNILGQYERFRMNSKKSEHPTINKVLKIIDSEYKEDLSLEELAARMKMTPEYLSALFMKELGVKFTTYYTQKRMEVAKQMLQKENKKIYEVAEASGYQDVKYFCKVFKKYTGTSPSEYVRSLN